MEERSWGDVLAVAPVGLDDHRHKIDSVLRRYDIVSDEDLLEAALKLNSSYRLATPK